MKSHPSSGIRTGAFTVRRGYRLCTSFLHVDILLGLLATQCGAGAGADVAALLAVGRARLADKQFFRS